MKRFSCEYLVRIVYANVFGSMNVSIAYDGTCKIKVCLKQIVLQLVIREHYSLLHWSKGFSNCLLMF